MKIGMISFDFEHHNTVDEMLDDAKHFGMTILDCGVDQFLDDPAGLDAVRKKMEAYGIEIESGFGDNYIELADKQPVNRFEALCKKVFVPLGIKTLATAAGHPSAHHRWHKEPPLEEQLQRMAAAIKNLAPVAEQYGITICIENHADYRVREIIRMLDIINSPNVRAKFDCANCLNVMEDPVDAARIIAPFVRSTHLKDNSLAPYTNGQMLCITPQILGEGDVDIATVIHILVQNVRDPQNLPWIIEIDGGTPPGKHSYESGIGNSIRYLRSLLEREGIK